MRRSVLLSLIAGYALGFAATLLGIGAIGAAVLCFSGIMARVGTGGNAVLAFDPTLLGVIAIGAAAAALGLGLAGIAICARGRRHAG